MSRSFRPLGGFGPATFFTLALLLLPPLPAQAGEETHADRARITIPTPRSANLLQLRGIGGRGSALLVHGGACYEMPVRLVAGDFNGMQSNVRDGAPIVLDIRDRGLVNALMSGTDVVSDGMEMSADPSNTSAAIVLLSGMDVGTGFVINPGRSLFADVFGARVSAVSCEAVPFMKTPASKG